MEKQARQKLKRGNIPLTPKEIRKRKEIGISMRFRGAEKDFIASLMEEFEDAIEKPFGGKVRVTQIFDFLLNQEYKRRQEAQA